MRAEVDRSKAVLLGVPVEDVYSALQAQFGSIQVSQFNQYSRVWNVVLQSDAPYRRDPADITRLYTRSTTARWSAVGRGHDRIRHQPGPRASFQRFSGCPGYRQRRPGIQLGDAIKAMEEVAAEVLPSGYGFAWSGMAYEEKKSGGHLRIGLRIRPDHRVPGPGRPVRIMDTAGIRYDGGALRHSRCPGLQLLRGLENDVYFQIGLLVLIGLGAKNAVLRVTFAVDLRKQGLSIMDATIQAGEERLRPIIMTSLAFIFGVLPLAIATGAGANARHSIGTGIMGGMIGEATLAMLYVPLFFYIFDRLSERSGKKEPTIPARRSGPAAPVRYPGGKLICAACHFAIAVLLSGCMVGPDYRRPAVDTPQSFRYEEKDARDTANTDWWKQFDDPVLDSLIAQALANNRTVKIAAANIEQAAGMLTQTACSSFPRSTTAAAARASA